MKKIEKQMEFLHEIDKIKDVFRQSLVLGKRRENDAEHSWHMAMTALTIREYFREDISLERVLKMILIHDLVEIYAGDTPAFGAKRPDKAHQELRAAKKIFSLLPEDQEREFLDLWVEFEECSTSDSRFANVCDRFQGFMQNLTSDGHTWKKFDVHIEKVLERGRVIELYTPELFHDYVMPQLQKYIDRGIIRV